MYSEQIRVKNRLADNLASKLSSMESRDLNLRILKDQ